MQVWHLRGVILTAVIGLLAGGLAAWLLRLNAPVRRVVIGMTFAVLVIAVPVLLYVPAIQDWGWLAHTFVMNAAIVAAVVSSQLRKSASG